MTYGWGDVGRDGVSETLDGRDNMIVKLERALVPNGAAIVHTAFRCNECEHRFEYLKSSDDEFVRFDCSDNVQRWMPLLGDHGYFKAIEELVPEADVWKEIPVRLSDKFERLFVDLQRKCGLSVSCVLSSGWACSKCGSNDLHIEDEVVQLHTAIDSLKVYIF